MSNTSGKRRIKDKIKETLDFPIGISKTDSHIEIRGKCSINVQGCEKITEYKEDVISVNLHTGGLSIRGENLYCTAYLSGAIEISGNIKSVEFTEEKA